MHQTHVAIGSERLFAKSKWQTRVISGTHLSTVVNRLLTSCQLFTTTDLATYRLDEGGCKAAAGADGEECGGELLVVFAGDLPYFPAKAQM